MLTIVLYTIFRISSVIMVILCKAEGRAVLEDAIPGEPQVDYPTYSSIPDTTFTCGSRITGGFYADVEARCQVFHICGSSNSIFGSVKYSFLCPNGTVFHEKYFTCDWWYNVDCQASQSYFDLNNNIGDEDSISILQ